jgi:probable F420-dependent oxidoreductase
MKIGLQIYLAGEAAAPAFLAAMAGGLEERGFHGVWLAEHVILPPVIASRYPYNPEGRFPADTRNLPLEPFTALAFIAAHSKALRLGTGVSVLPQRNPVFMAKQVADVDVLSQGRVDYGIGAGWCVEEIERLGVPPARRGARTDDYIRLMKAIWTEETIRHDGEFYRLPESHSGPKPVQKPHPPLFIGGNSEAALRRVARLGDGWFAAALSPADYAAAVGRLHEACAREGRDPAGVRLIVAPPDGKASLDMVKGYRDAGAEQVIVSIGSRGIERFLARIDGLAADLVAPAAAL